MRLYRPSHLRFVLWAAGCLVAAGCRSGPPPVEPSVAFTTVPVAAEGGSERLEMIAGRVVGAQPDQRIVLYARSSVGVWWVQPLTTQPFTAIGADSTWSNRIHLGIEYAALLVRPGYRPPDTTEVLPRPGGDVIAVATVKGTGTFVPAPLKRLTFSGYEWEVRQTPSDRGGANDYASDNAWTDPKGFLHLRLIQRDGRWTSAQVALTRALGYGTYTFVVGDTPELDPCRGDGAAHLRQSGSGPESPRARHRDQPMGRSQPQPMRSMSIQPYYVAANVTRFEAPRGRIAHSFRWEPGRALFKTVRLRGDVPAEPADRPARIHLGRPDSRRRARADESVLLPLLRPARRKARSRSSLSGFSTCHRRPWSRRRIGRGLLAAAVTLCLASAAEALDPERALSQYLRDQWGSERGFPGGPVYGFAQTADGYLWIATAKGLVRFDGLSFRLFEPSGSTAGTGPTVLGVAAASDGSVWARLAGAALVRFRHGAFDNMLPSVGLPESVVTAMFRRRDDDMLVVSLGHGAVAYRTGRPPTVISPDHHADLLVRAVGRGDARRRPLVRDARCRSAAAAGCAGDPDRGGPAESEGQLSLDWKRRRALDWHRRGACALGGWRSHHKGGAGSGERRDGTGDDSGPRFEPLDRGGCERLAQAQHARCGTLADADSACAGAVTAVFEDRDGNVWVGTTTGIERLRDGAFTTYSSLHGLPAGGVGAVHIDRTQRTWFAPAGRRAVLAARRHASGGSMRPA